MLGGNKTIRLLPTYFFPYITEMENNAYERQICLNEVAAERYCFLLKLNCQPNF